MDEFMTLKDIDKNLIDDLFFKIEENMMGFPEIASHIDIFTSLHIKWQLTRQNRYIGTLLDLLAEDTIDMLAGIVNCDLKAVNEIVKALYIEYDPISNYDRTQTQTTKQTNPDVVEIESTSKDGNTTVKNNVSAFNSSDMTPSNEQETTRDQDTTNSRTTTTRGEMVFEDRTTGNIGVTTSQQMLESEFAMRANHSIEKYYFDMLDKNFLLPIL